MIITDELVEIPNFDWLRSLPADWNAIQLKRIAKIKYGLGQPPRQLAGGLPLIRATNVYRGKITTNDLVFVDPDDVPYDRDPVLKTNDIIVVRSGAYTGDSAIIPPEFEGSISGYDMVVRATHVNPQFLAFSLLSIPVLNHQIDLCRLRAAQPHLNAEELGETILCVPPLAEQESIAGFLDRKTSQIDALISKKQRQIELLGEKRQALISQAVTKSLDPNVPMKESSMEWLGEVPEHWMVERLKLRMKSIEQGWSPQCDTRRAESGEWGVLKVGCMNSGRYDENENKALPSDVEPKLNYEIRVGDVLMSRSNTVELVGAVGRVHETQGRILLCDKLYRLDLDEKQLDPDFAVHLLRSRAARFQLERDASGASPSMKNISNERVQNMVLPFPSIDEQQSIVHCLNRELERSRKTEETIYGQLKKLREYRQTIISAAVTGKIDVTMEVP